MHRWSQPTVPSSYGRNSYHPGHVSPHSRRGGRGGKPTLYSHRNRSLVLNSSIPTMNTVDGNRIDSPDGVAMKMAETRSSVNLVAQAAPGWISKRDRHMQLINSSIYNREASLRSKAIDHTRRQVARRRDERERSKIHTHMQTIADSVAATPSSHQPSSKLERHELSINGLRFQVCDGGSKLLRTISKVISVCRVRS